MEPSHRLSALDAALDGCRRAVDRLRYRGRLTRQSPQLDELLRVRVRQAVLARLAGSVGESAAHLEVGRCYRLLELWPHALAHARKALALLGKGATPADAGAAALDPCHRGRVLCLMGESLARTPQKSSKGSGGGAASGGYRTVEARRVLLRAAKLVGLKMDGGGGGGGDDDDAQDAADAYSDDEDAFEQDDDGGNARTRSSGRLVLKRIARAEVCEAIAAVCRIAAVEADAALRHKARQSAEEWMGSKEGQRRLQERTTELTNRFMEQAAAAAVDKTRVPSRRRSDRRPGGGPPGGSWRPGMNVAAMKRTAKKRARKLLLKEATADVTEQLLEQGERNSHAFHRQAVDWLTRAWELRDAAFGSAHPECALAYERLGRAHLRAARSEAGQQGGSTSGVEERRRDAADVLRAALRILAASDQAGRDTPAHARVSQALARACRGTGDLEGAATHTASAAEFYEREAARGLRCLERDGVGPEQPDADAADPEQPDAVADAELPIVIEQAGGKESVVLPLAVGSLAAADKALSLCTQAAAYFVSAMHKAEDAAAAAEEAGIAAGRDDDLGDAEIRIGTACMAVLKGGVRVAANYYGGTSIEVARALEALGGTCGEFGWDFKLSERALGQARGLFALAPHGAERAKAISRKLRRLKAQTGGTGGGVGVVGGRRAVLEDVAEEEDDDDDDDDELDADADWLR